MKKKTLFCLTMASLAGLSAGAQEAQTVPKAQYDQLLKEHEQMKRDMEEFRQFKAQMLEQMKGVTNVSVAVAPAGTNVLSADVQKDIDSIRDMAKRSLPGSDKFLFGGYASANYHSFDNRGGQAFGAQFNPIFLWKLSDRLLFEGEVEMELEDGETSTALEIAQLSYLLNDYVTFGAGKFLNPMNAFVEKYHMAWVNRLPDKPLAVYDGLLPETYVGAQMHGGLPVGSTKINWAAFVGNAPSLTLDADDPSGIGTLEWDNFDNAGNHLAFGGHVGFQPIPELEIGYGVHFSEVGPKSSATVNALLQSVDLSYILDVEKLAGAFRMNAQWVWSHVDRFDYGPGFGRFDNSRDGGYAQIAYRGTHLKNPWMRNLEPVFRYDILNQQDTPVGYDEDRCTIGLNYWITPMTVFKAAYQFDNRHGSGAEDANGVLLEFATGF